MQEEVIKSNRNLIFSAPTSAGKSIVADLLYLRNLVLQPDKCVIYVMPFVSLIAEKEKKLKKLCEILKLKFMSIYSHKRAQFGEEMPNLVVCTVEKAG